MGVFDTMEGHAICPHCQTINPAFIQFKWLSPSMRRFHIGDYISGNAPFEVLSVDRTSCIACDKSFQFYAIGHFGKLYGFANEIQKQQMESFLWKSDDDPISTVTLVISPDIQEKPEEILRLLAASLQEDPKRSVHYLGFHTKNLSSYVCRFPAFISPNIPRPKIGDTVYYDNRKSPMEYWELQDTEFEIEEAVFDEERQLYHYTIRSKNGDQHYTNVLEHQLCFSEERNKRKNELEENMQKILDYANGKHQKSSIWLRFHATPLVTYMKQQKMIPDDFEF